MKKTLSTITIVLFAVLLLPSCKKDRTCTCNVDIPGTTTDIGGVITSHTSFDTTIRYDQGKQSKNDANNTCNGHQTSLTTIYRNDTNNATVNCGI